MTLVDLMGYAAGALTAGAQLPQAIKAWRTRSTDDLSVWALLALAVGLGCWLAYGIAKGDVPLILANGVSVSITLAVLAAKLIYG